MLLQKAAKIVVLGVLLLNPFPLESKQTDPKNLAFASYKPPLFFAPNHGLFEKDVKFYLQDGDRLILFADKEIIWALKKNIIRQSFIDANDQSLLKGSKKLLGRIHYLKGERKNWERNIPTYEEIVYQNLYPGVDFVIATLNGKLKSEFRVAAGKDYKKILLAWNGINALSIADNGELLVQGVSQRIKENKPFIYQKMSHKTVEIDGNFIQHQNQISFEIPSYDKKFPLIIDPEIVYSTYLGGEENEDGFYRIAVDSTSHSYVINTSSSSNFPTTDGAFQTIDPHPGGDLKDIVITKLSPDGSRLIYSTYLGAADGIGAGHASDIAVDAEGNVYVTGFTQSEDFPTQNSISDCEGFRQIPFITKLSADGSSLIYSSCLNRATLSPVILPTGIAVDPFGNAYITGHANPMVANGDLYHSVVLKVTSDGSQLAYIFRLEGRRGVGDTLMPHDIAVDSMGAAYVTGSTSSNNFPVQNAFQPALAGANDAFVTKISPDGGELIYSTYLGGDEGDIGYGITVDSAGAAYIVGTTGSQNFPLQNPFQPELGGGSDSAFVTKLSPDGAQLIYSTYLGGDRSDVAYAIAVDSGGFAYVVGDTTSGNFPVQNALQPAVGGGTDAFITKISPDGAQLIYSTYWGGNSSETGQGIAADPAGNTYVTGGTRSPNFPIRNAFQSEPGSDVDAFVLKLSPGFPDLIIQAVEARRSLNQLALIVTVANQGERPVIGPVSIGIRPNWYFKQGYNSQFPILRNGERLAPQQTINKTIYVAPANSMTLKIDVSNRVQESNEDNNIFTYPQNQR